MPRINGVSLPLTSLWHHRQERNLRRELSSIHRGFCPLLGRPLSCGSRQTGPGKEEDVCAIRSFNDGGGPGFFIGLADLGGASRILGVTHAEVGSLVATHWNFSDTLVEVIRDHHTPKPGAFLSNLVNLSDLLVRSRIPFSPYDETLAFVLEESPVFREVFKGIPEEDLDIERITFSIDDELEHAITFVQLAFQD